MRALRVPSLARGHALLPVWSPCLSPAQEGSRAVFIQPSEALGPHRRSLNETERAYYVTELATYSDWPAN